MITHQNLAKLLDDVADHAARVEIVVDNRLELSIAATITTDVLRGARAALTRYSTDSMAEALGAALVDAAGWINGHVGQERRIAIDTIAPQLEVIATLKLLLAADEDAHGREAYPLLGRARRALAAIGVTA